jgi:hypothetical protein
MRGISAALFGLAIGMLSGCGDDDGGDGQPGADAAGFDQAPIVFLHGCPPPPIDNVASAGLWTGDTQQLPAAVDFFADRGYPDDHLNVFVYDGPNCAPNFDYAEQVADYVQTVIAATGKPRVDILAISMAAVAGRIYLRQGGTEFVEDFVSIVGANHGSVLAGMVGEAARETFPPPNWEGAFEASPAYACGGESTEADVQFFLNGCLTEDGRTVDEDETPDDIDEGGHVRYLSIWNDQDDLVVPQEASCLNQAFQNDCSDPVNLRFSVAAMTEVVPGSGLYSAHVETEFHQPTRQAMYDFVTAPRE